MKRTFLGIFGIFLLLIVLTLALAPGLAKRYVVKHSPN